MAFDIRVGPAKEFIFDSMELDPAEGSELTYTTIGYHGPVHVSGNGNVYGESQPHVGYVKQDISVNPETFKKLKAIQTARRFAALSVTTPGNDLLIGNMAIGNDGPIENANGVVSLELYGKLELA
jgi:hypothetical protein